SARTSRGRSCRSSSRRGGRGRASSWGKRRSRPPPVVGILESRLFLASKPIAVRVEPVRVRRLYDELAIRDVLAFQLWWELRNTFERIAALTLRVDVVDGRDTNAGRAEREEIAQRRASWVRDDLVVPCAVLANRDGRLRNKVRPFPPHACPNSHGGDI